MSKLLSNPKAVTLLAVAGIVMIVSIAGGVLGNEFGGGFLGAPLANIQLRAESITEDGIIGSFKITNTMVGTWITVLVLLTIALIVRLGLKEVPGRLQGLTEVVIEFFLNLAESVAGPEKARRFLPLVLTIFLFIVTANWLGILPGFGTIGRIESAEEIIAHAVEEAAEDNEEADLKSIKLQIFDGDGSFGILNFGSVQSSEDQLTAADYDADPEGSVEEGKQAGILVPFLRSANTEVNTTLAIALVTVILVNFWGFRSLGVFGHMGKFLNFKGGPIGLFVGILEAISEVARLISFTFRLFGNIFAGEVLLAVMAFLVPMIGLIPFLGLELFVGLIQAFIFAMLTLVFASMATLSHGTQEH